MLCPLNLKRCENPECLRALVCIQSPRDNPLSMSESCDVCGEPEEFCFCDLIEYED